MKQPLIPPAPPWNDHTASTRRRNRIQRAVVAAKAKMCAFGRRAPRGEAASAAL
jgi:hypothetical protein